MPEVDVGTLETLRDLKDKKLAEFPSIGYSTLYKRVLDHFYFEFELDEGSCLFSPYFTILIGDGDTEAANFVTANEGLFDSVKKFILNSLFVYSALIEENSYYLLNSQSILIARLIHKRDARFEVKFYTHYEDELMANYKDKIYIGRDFINLKKFDRKYLGLKKYFLSMIDQNDKIQERAKHKLRYFDDYKEPFLDEINYLVQETVAESMERIQTFPQCRLSDIPKGKFQEVLDNIFFLNNLMVEMRDLNQEFENKLRQNGEHDFVKYQTKFSKDMIDGIRYLRKLSCHLHLKISNYSIF